MKNKYFKICLYFICFLILLFLFIAFILGYYVPGRWVTGVLFYLVVWDVLVIVVEEIRKIGVGRNRL